MEKIFRIQLNELYISQDRVVPSKVQLLKTGTFNHPVYGKIDITNETLVKFQENFDKKVRGVDLSIDYSHNSEGKSAGWIKVLYIEDGKLFAEVNWTNEGQKILAEKEFRYLSADFSFNYKSNENNVDYGPTLLGAGLTNRPFVKNMEPITFSELNNNGGTMNELEKLKAENEELKKKIAELESMKSDHEKMKGKVSEYELAEKKRKDEEAVKLKEESFNKLLTEKKVVPAQKESYMSGDMVKFSELATTLNDGNGTNKTNNDKFDPIDEVKKLAEEKRKENKNLSIAESISVVLSERKDLSGKIYKENKE